MLIAVIGATVYYVYSNLDAIVKAAIEQAGSQTTQTAVRVDKVKITLSDGAGSIKGLSIANPKGFESPNAFVLGAIDTQIDIKSLTKEPIVIDKVIIHKPQVFYEMNSGRESNLNELYKNIASATAGKSGAKKPAPATKGPEPKLIIRHFQVADGTVEANVVPLTKKYSVKLPAIDLKDLGGKSGATPSEISKQVLDTITHRALAAVKQAGIEQKVEALKSEAQKKLDTKKDEVESKAKEKLKGLFGK